MGRTSSGYEDHEFVAQLYDASYDHMDRHDIEFYVDYSRKADGRTLELGCGTGRVLIPTAKAGCEITGLDFSNYMLEICRQKLVKLPREVQAHVNLIRADMTNFELDEQFALITIPFRPFQHLITTDEQKACLRCVWKHLRPDGLFVMDVYQTFVPRFVDPKYFLEIDIDPKVELPDGSILRRTGRVAAFHRVEQYNDCEIIHYVTHPDGREERFVHSFPMRYFFRYEMEHLLSLCGFKVKEFFGDFDRSAFKADSLEMIFVVEKR
jgi:SAM-dependent methyltransferase